MLRLDGRYDPANSLLLVSPNLNLAPANLLPQIETAAARATGEPGTRPGPCQLTGPGLLPLRYSESAIPAKIVNANAHAMRPTASNGQRVPPALPGSVSASFTSR